MSRPGTSQYRRWPALLLLVALALGLLGCVANCPVARTQPTAVIDSEWRTEDLSDGTIVMLPRHGTGPWPVVVLVGGLGRPSSPESVRTALPPIGGAISIYVPLHYGSESGWPTDLAARQQQNYLGQIFTPFVQSTAAAIAQHVGEVRTRYPQASDRLVLFGFSIGGSAVLAALEALPTPATAAVLLNAPLSTAQALDNYTVKARQPHPSGALPELLPFDSVERTARFAGSHPDLRLMLVQSAGDEPLTVAAATALLEDLRRQRSDDDDQRFEVRPLGQGHNVLLDGEGDATAEAGILREWLVTALW